MKKVYIVIISCVLAACAEPIMYWQYSDIVPVPAPPKDVYTQDELIYFSLGNTFTAGRNVYAQAVTLFGDKISGQLIQTTDNTIMIDRSAIPHNSTYPQDRVTMDKKDILFLRVW